MTLCHVCRRWQPLALCEDCIRDWAHPQTRCATCALPLAPGCDDLQIFPSHPHLQCAACAEHPSPLDACVAAVDYAFPWSEGIRRLKFEDAVGLSRPLAALMRHTPWAEPLLEQADRVIPMPLSPHRLQTRGYNQALELARHLAEAPRLDLHSLQRLETGSHQVGASRAQRLAQAGESFWLAPSAVSRLRGQRVVLIDDVMTTGATLWAAAHLLRQAGACHVAALVLARTPAHAPAYAPALARGDADGHRRQSGDVQHRAGPP